MTRGKTCKSVSCVSEASFTERRAPAAKGAADGEHTQHWGSTSVAVCVRQVEVASPGRATPAQASEAARLRGQLPRR